MSGLIGGHITGQALRVAQETIESDGSRSRVVYDVVTNLDELRIDQQLRVLGSR